MAKLWGSRFPKKTNQLTDRFTASISFDKVLARYDILGSIAHARMLGRQKIIPAKDAARLVSGLQALLKQVEAGRFKFDPAAEDIHSNIQEALAKRIGSAADKLHTARSRNDQIVLDLKMYLKDEVAGLVTAIAQLQKSIVRCARDNQKVIIPGYTHLQRAQCVLLAHHLLAYVEGLERDKSRLQDARKRIDAMPLGSGAFSGTGLPIDRQFVSEQLGFATVTDNSIDSVSDRDFVLEVLAALSIASVHLSRIAEDLILWSTKEFDFFDLDFSFCTGSSIMPHKKNPDVLELVRASVGRIYGDLSSVVMVMKGLPLSYNRDLQLDKPPLFDAIATMQDILEILSALFGTLTVKKGEIAAKLQDESLFCVDILEYLIIKGLSYRQAHDLVGRMVRDCLDRGRKLSSLSDRELRAYCPQLGPQVRRVLNPLASVQRKKSSGSTNPRLVAAQLNKWRRRLD